MESASSKTAQLDFAYLEDEIHIWEVHLENPDIPLETCWELLNKEERNRASRFHRENERQHFVFTHGILYLILSRYLSITPGQILLGYDAYGRPYIKNIPNDVIDFNLSHSHDIALFALTKSCRIGVDVERIKILPDIDHIVHRVFSDRERIALEGLPTEQKHYAFYRLWTMKEAYAKGIGYGLALPLDQLELFPTITKYAEWLYSGDANREFHGWTIRLLDSISGYSASVAVDRPVCNLLVLDWKASCNNLSN